MSTLGDYIAKKRQEKRLTQRELAQKCGYSHTAIQKIESGNTEHPGIDVLVALSKALNISVVRLIIAYQGKDPEKEPVLDYQLDEETLKKLEEFKAFQEWHEQQKG